MSKRVSKSVSRIVITSDTHSGVYGKKSNFAISGVNRV